MQSLIRLAGYVALLLTPAALLGRALVASGPSTGALGLGTGVVLTGGVSLVMERERTVVAPDASGFGRADAANGFAGFGGKLGTLALFGCATTAALTGTNYVAGSPLAWANADLVVPVSVAGAVATAVLSVRLGSGAVVGSALVGFAAGIGLPPVFPEFGGTLAAAAFCASFVGMSSPDRLADEWQVALAGAVCGLVFVAVSAVLVGAGGKLGTVAFVSCVTVFGGEKLLARSLPE